MSRRFSYRVEQACSAPATAVYRVLEDVHRWREWMPAVQTACWDQRGQTTPSGRGAIRSMTVAGRTVREQVIAADPPHHQSYTALSGLPVTDYTADITIESRDGGCVITWAASFLPKVPATGHLIRLVMQASMSRVARALARESERVHRTE